MGKRMRKRCIRWVVWKSKKLSVGLVIIVIFGGVGAFCYNKYHQELEKPYNTAIRSTTETIFKDTIFEKDALLSEKSAYQLGVNKKGKLIFLNPEVALKSGMKDFKEGFQAIEVGCNLKEISLHNYKVIHDYTQEYFVNDEELNQEIGMAQGIVDIYENSFYEFENMPN